LKRGLLPTTRALVEAVAMQFDAIWSGRHWQAMSAKEILVPTTKIYWGNEDKTRGQ